MKFTFVRYNKAYLHDATKMMGKTWEFDKCFKNLKDKDIIYSTLFKISYADSNYCDMTISENGDLMGFLIGGETTEKINFSQVKLMCSIFWNVLIGKFGSWKIVYDFAKKGFKDLAPLMESQKEYDNEIKLFFVAEKSRGTGLGKTLMNRYVEHCRINNIKSIILITDEGCNYGFYEYYGYERVNQIHSSILAKPELEYNGYTYAYKIK